MTSLLWLNDPAFKVYAVCAVVVLLKMFFIAGYTGVVRRRTGTTMNAEDARIFGAKHVELEHPDVQRVHRIHRNDLENIPAFLALGLIAVLAGVPVMGAEICFIGFAVARVSHTVMYLNALQPWRSLSFGLGMLANASLMVMILIRVFA